MNQTRSIYFDLRAKIQTKEYPPGSFLPSEPSLATSYGVSRETIRKALKHLADEGLIQKQRGLGSKVLDHQEYRFPVSGLTSFKELQEAQLIPARTQVMVNQVVPAPKFLVDKGLVQESESMIHLVRLRYLEGKPCILDSDYLRHPLVVQVPSQEAENSLYQYLEKDLGFTIAYAKKVFSAEPVTLQDQDLLDIQDNSHVVVVRSEVYLDNTTFFQYSESRHCLDKFRFVEFARRKTELIED